MNIRTDVDPQSPVPVHEQVSASFRKAIWTRQVSPEEKLPSVRELAAQLSINPLTVARAYLSLEQEGLVTGHVGRGTFVARNLPKMDEARRHRELERHVKQFLLQNGWLIRSHQEVVDLLKASTR